MWQVHQDGPQLKMICIFKKWRNLKTDTYAERIPYDIKTATYRPKKETWDRSFPQSPQKGPSLPTPWFQMSSLPNCGRINFCCLRHSICYGSLSTLMEWWRPCGVSSRDLDGPPLAVSGESGVLRRKQGWQHKALFPVAAFQCGCATHYSSFTSTMTDGSH